jgi:cell division protein DivIC
MYGIILKIRIRERYFMAGKRRKNGRNAGAKSIIFIVLVFVVVMSIQIYKMKEKDAILAEREQNLILQLEEELKREEELKELDLYTRSMEYIKDMANTLGLVYENEIIFKESGE